MIYSLHHRLNIIINVGQYVKTLLYLWNLLKSLYEQCSVEMKN